MNKKEFSTYLHHPHLIDKHAEIALQEVVADFPYFHAAQQLLLKAHQNNGSYHFDRQLPIASLLHGNRALLYAYLKDSLVKEFEWVAQNDLNATEEVFNEFISEEKREEPEIQLGIEKDEVVNESEPLIPESENLNYVINEDLNNAIIENDLVENEKSFEIPTDLVPKDSQILESLIIFDDIELPFQNFDQKYSIPETLENEIKPEEEPVVEIPISIERVEEPKATPAEEHIIETIEPHDFISWLQAKKTHHTHTPKPDEKPLQIEKAIQTEQPIDIKTENKIENSEKKIKKFNSLIDKFIENSPSISKPQAAKFYNPAQKAKESITENFDLVSETLAKIYMKQHNYKKALLVYEKLSLLYPEKISYFATQISDLQTLLNK